MSWFFSPSHSQCLGCSPASPPLLLSFSPGPLMSCKKASMDSHRAPSTSQRDCNHGYNFLSKANLLRETKESSLMRGFLVCSSPLCKLTERSRRTDRVTSMRADSAFWINSRRGRRRRSQIKGSGLFMLLLTSKQLPFNYSTAVWLLGFTHSQQDCCTQSVRCYMEQEVVGPGLRWRGKQHLTNMFRVYLCC